MKTVKVIINKPIEVVWNYFKDLKRWKSWWGVSPKYVVPGWQTGGKLIFDSGEECDLFVQNLTEIRIISRWVENIYRFQGLADGRTQVEYEFSSRGGASFTDGGYSYMMKMVETLHKLKKGVESLADVQTGAFTNRGQSKKWWQFWK